ncbi:uncharacterized protein IUM83_10399 [Phytophthora cinnamomi]|uniref:uncharacterized protein n=1 Tax=Phytophthora cinnamomi TaxID=4785 RepID=UPI00355955D0|nr:hypothetical protein IUM83_10399 [Phytophthora cinnamomi]
MVGLSASELQAETLFPGDTVEYFSMAFVAGDPRGHRVSKVLRIDRKDDEFPIRVDTQEMLPLTMMLKRKRDRNDVDISSDDAKWRKLRTFRLVDGEVEGETRADRLNAELKKGLEEAMKATKKMLAKEKAEKANAGSKKIMSSYFTSSADETRNRKYSFEKQATPERKKKTRKPLTPRENTDHALSSRPHDKVELKKRHGGEKASPKRRPEGETARPEQRFKYDKHNETTKHTSLKRKRSGSTPTRPEQRDAALKTSQKTISKFFGAPKKKSILGKFMEHVEEIHDKQSTAVDLNAYLALENEKLEAVKTVEDEMKAVGGRQSASKSASDHHNNASKKDWNERRTHFRSKQPSINLRSWLTPLDRQKGGLEDASSDTPKEAPRPKQRRPTLAPGRPATAMASPKMNSKTGLSFMNSGDASHHATDTKSSSQRDTQPLKKRGSLGTVSARAPKKNLMGQWNHKKIAR